jgi:hypothetical protein
MLSCNAPHRHHGVVTQSTWGARRHARGKSYLWLPPLIGVAISLAQIKMVSTAWDDCNISGSTGLTTTSLYLLGLPALTFLNWLLVALPAEVYLTTRRSLIHRWLLAIVTTAVLVTAETVVLAYYVATPTVPVGDTCVENVPDWWPEQIPV